MVDNGILQSVAQRGDMRARPRALDILVRGLHNNVDKMKATN